MKISVSFLGFSSVEKLETAIQTAKAQTVNAELELIVCDPEAVLNNNKLEQLCTTYLAVCCKDASDPMGFLCASGEYIAIYKNGFNWTNANKLERQIAVLNQDAACNLVIHDVELLKENGRPVDQSYRNNIMRAVSFEDRYYRMEQLQQFKNCGFMGTWVFRNVFQNDKQRHIYQTAGLESVLCATTLLVADGYATNLFDDRFASWKVEDKVYQMYACPKYDRAQIQEMLNELDRFQSLLKEHYGVETDNSYRLLNIANGAFNYMQANGATEESVKTVQDAIEKAFRQEYVDENVLLTVEANVYKYLCKKIRMYLTEKGTTVAAPLVACLNGITDAEWSYSIRACKNRTVKKAMREKFSAQRPDAKAFLASEARKKNPVSVFVGKVFQKLGRIFRGVMNLGRRVILYRMRRKGYSGYMSQEWYNTVKEDLRNDKKTPLKRKIWCYRRGFTPWRVKQYGLDESTIHSLPSDRDYMYLHQMNNSYKKWIEDKMTFRLVLEPFKQYLPKYYFQIIQRDDRQLIVRLPDCPDGYEPTFDELFRLLRQEGKLALKAASGTHGVGFYKMHYEDGKYYLNNEEKTQYQIQQTINSFKSFYVVTNYINMHDQIKEIYAGSVNTIRVMMINRDGHHPQLMDAYMRIGTEKSGVTDNVAFGGVVCSVDLQTGEYGNGMRLQNHVYVPIDTHPDTGTPLKGVIPNWQTIRKAVEDISGYMCQLEYLGFDVVCTPEGCTILEINSHQDLHRLPYYDQRVRDFFFYKLRRKEYFHKIKRKV